MRVHYIYKLLPLILLAVFLTIGPYLYNDDTGQNSTLSFKDNGPNFPNVNSNPAFAYYEDKHMFAVPTVAQSSISSEYNKLFENVKEMAAKNLQTSKTNFKNGMYRLLAEGLEFDLYFQVNGINKRVSIFQPLGAPSHIHHFDVDNSQEVVNIVVSLQKKLEPLSIFLDHLIHVIYPSEKNITLTVVYFADSSSEEAHNLLQQKLVAAPALKWSFVLLNDSAFSRGRGLQVGVNHVGRSSSDLVFLCDVDILMTPDFFSRCRSNTLEKKQVYYPIVFSLYNPEVVYAARGEPVPHQTKQTQVGSDNGFWRDFGFGMACMHKSELDSVGGMPDIKGWGGEDLKLYEHFKANPQIKEIRAPDPGLFHMYHSKNCSQASKETLANCLFSKVIVEGSQIHLGLSLFKMSEGVDVAAALRHRYGDAGSNEYPVELCISLVAVSFAFMSVSIYINRKRWSIV